MGDYIEKVGTVRGKREGGRLYLKGGDNKRMKGGWEIIFSY